MNAIVKYFFKTDRERGRNLTVLLCGEAGLVMALEAVFSFGFKSNRLWGQNIYLWDYFGEPHPLLFRSSSFTALF